MPINEKLAFVEASRSALDCRPAPLCDPRPVCPACGGLECLCRPRFFAGQLLTDEDLNRLDYYIAAKNRLHNRHLFGSGVVCGLEVVCSTCDPAGNGGVVVRPGYALSPCGNDIVLCREESVDICDLINRCRPRVADECFQPTGNAADNQQSTEEWVLAICYQETPSRGVTALRGASCSCNRRGGSGCSCGGATSSASNAATYSSSAGCGCGGATVSQTAKTKPAVKPGAVPAQCEPTLTCEGYTFAVYRLPKADSRKADPGALVRRFLCCLQPLLEQLVRPPRKDANQQGLHDWLVSQIAAVREFLITEGLYDCDIAARLSAVALPPRQAATDVYLKQWSAATLSIFAIITAVFQKCLCAALLPPCPPSELNDCVPIATLTVSNRNCRVRHICNLESRRVVPTIPNIEYWLSWLPLFSPWKSAAAASQPGSIASAQPGNTLADFIKRICCTPVSELFRFDDAESIDLNPDRQVVVEKTAATSAAKIHPFVRLLGESLLGTGQANAATVLLAAMGAQNKDGTPFVSGEALEHPAEAMLIHQVLGPALAPLLPLLGVLQRAPDKQGGKDLAAELEELKKTVRKQQNAIAELQSKR